MFWLCVLRLLCLLVVLLPLWPRERWLVAQLIALLRRWSRLLSVL